MQQAIDILKAMKRKAEIKRWTGCGYMIDTLDEAIQKIEALGDGWIPVTERFPEDNTYVLVSDGHNTNIAIGYATELGVWKWFGGTKDWTNFMPLPLPPNK